MKQTKAGGGVIPGGGSREDCSGGGLFGGRFRGGLVSPPSPCLNDHHLTPRYRTKLTTYNGGDSLNNKTDFFLNFVSGSGEQIPEEGERFVKSCELKVYCMTSLETKGDTLK